MVRRIAFALTCCFLGFDSVSAEDQQTWPQWRGPGRDGQVAGPTWPERVGPESVAKRWSVSLEPSYSGPVVSERFVYVTETRDEKTEVVSAWDRSTGTKVWETSWPGSMSVPFFAKANGDWIRSTPALDGDSLFVAGMRDVLVCLNAENGDVRWKLDCAEKFGSDLPSFGFVASPLVIGDHVYVQAGGGFVKVDKRTGEVLWRTLEDGGGMYGSAFSSPVLARLGGREQLVVQTRKDLTGVDPESGKVLWTQEIPAFRGMNILTPTVIGDAVFTSSYGGGTFLYEIGQQPDQPEVKSLWRNKVQGYMSSPVVIEGHVYLHLRNQRFACIDLATGEEKWITKPYGKYWSMVAQGNRILALDERGDLLLIDASPKEFRLVDQMHVSDEPTWAHLAICGNELYVRDLKGLTVYQWNSDSGRTAQR